LADSVSVIVYMFIMLLFYISSHRRQSSEEWGVATPDFDGGGVAGSLLNITICYNVQEYEMRTPFKVVTFRK